MNRAVLFLSVTACTDASLPADPDEPTVPTTPSVTDTDTDTAVDADADGWSAELDCDDADAAVYPGAPDICGDDRVTDCDRSSDDGLATVDGTATFDDLREAVEAATTGSEVRVCPGTWRGPIVATVPIRLVAHADAATTILDGQGQNRTLAVVGGSEVVGFTIQRGWDGEQGGGLLLTDAGSLLVQDCIVTENNADVGGGIAVGEDSTLTLVDTVVRENRALNWGGGVFVDARSVLDLSAGSSLSGNHATTLGGGAFVMSASLVGGTVDTNDTDGFGGGVLVFEGTIDGTIVSGNRAGNGGGGVTAYGNATLRNIEITDNAALYGGGISTQGEDGNYAGYVLTIEDSRVSANVADGVGEQHAREGGGIFTYWTLSMTDTAVEDNSGESGGGVYVLGGPATMSGGSLVGNTASVGGGVLLDAGGSFRAETVDFADNLPGDVFTGGQELGGFGSGASISCDDAGCE